MPKSSRLNIEHEFKKVTFLKNRTPETKGTEFEGAFAMLSEYRDGGVFITHYSGFSEWERHANGDEFVQVIEGITTIVLLEKNLEQATPLNAGEMIVVPKGVWHRFESPEGVKVMTITPQPTDHSIARPKAD